jgi:hypothetical protein
MVRAAVAGARAHPAPGAGFAPICACVQSSNLEHAHKVKRNCAPKDPATRSGPQRQGSMNDEKKSARSSVVAGRRSRGTRTPWRSSVDHATPPAGRGASRWPRGPCNAASALVERGPPPIRRPRRLEWSIRFSGFRSIDPNPLADIRMEPIWLDFMDRFDEPLH